MSETRIIKASTKAGYEQRLKKLNDGKDVENYAFLYNIEIVMDKIKDLTLGTQRNYIISIVQALRDVPVMSSVLEKYTTIMNDMNTALKKNNTKSVVQKENWCTQEQIEGVYKTLLDSNIDLFVSKKKIGSEIEWDKVLEVVILALYVLQAPRRILDYTAMYIVKKMPKEIDQSINYYDLSSDTFYFNNYKTAGTYKTQSFKAPSKLATLLESYVKIHPVKLTATGKIPMLCKFNGSLFEKTYAITKILNRVFKRDLGKRVSVNLLRNIYLTTKFGPKVAELSDTASKMGTSSNTIENQYIKID